MNTQRKPAAQGTGIQDTDATEDAVVEVDEITVAARAKTAANSSGKDGDENDLTKAERR